MSAPAADERLAAAPAYRARGWSVIPVELLGKKPLVPWRRFPSGRASADTSRRWLELAPQANVAIVTGRLAGIVVLDADPDHGGADILVDVEREVGALPRTVGATSAVATGHPYRGRMTASYWRKSSRALDRATSSTPWVEKMMLVRPLPNWHACSAASRLTPPRPPSAP
jgi:hypothetical protein